MSGQYAQSQKSMEDILSSIRETIEEDIREGRRWTDTPFGPAISPVDHGGVLELTQVLNEDGSVTDLGAAPQEPSFARAVEPTAPVALSLVPDAPTFSQTERASGGSDAFVSQELSREPVFSAPGQGSASQDDNVFVLSQQAPTLEEESQFSSLQEPTQAPASPQTPYIRLQTPAQAPSFYQEAPLSPPLASQPQPLSFVQPPQETVSMQASPAPQTESEILSQETLEASSQALSELTQVFTEPQSPKEILLSDTVGTRTVEELMQELLRPMLKEWLDAHLPSLVKWIVTEQIEKVMQQSRASDKSTS